MRGGDSPSTEMAREYAQALRSELDAEEKTHINIWLVDERLTTVSAHRALHEAGVSSRDFKTMVDQVAAVNILQYSLDALKAGQSVAGYKVSDPPTKKTDRPSQKGPRLVPSTKRRTFSDRTE